MSKASAGTAGAARAARESTRQGIQSIELGAGVLLAMEASAGPMGLTEIAQRAGMEPSKVHRYLVSMRRSGLVSQAPSGQYDYGPTMRRLGAEALRRTNEVTVASAWLPGLRDSTGHSVNLSVWGDDGPIIVRWDHGTFALPITVRVGATLPMLSSSAGQVFLAALPEALTERALRNAHTSDGKPPSANRLRTIKALVRKTSVAVTEDGVVPGIASISAAVCGTGDALPVAISVVLPDELLTPAERERVTTLLLETTASIRRKLEASR